MIKFVDLSLTISFHIETLTQTFFPPPCKFELDNYLGARLLNYENLKVFWKLSSCLWKFELKRKGNEVTELRIYYLHAIPLYIFDEIFVKRKKWRIIIPSFFNSFLNLFSCIYTHKYVYKSTNKNAYIYIYTLFINK